MFLTLLISPNSILFKEANVEFPFILLIASHTQVHCVLKLVYPFVIKMLKSREKCLLA